MDPRLDARVREILRAGGVSLGHVVVLDPHSGEVLAYVSTDPDRFPATRAYPMASLAKLVTAAAALRQDPEIAKRDCGYSANPYRLAAHHLAAGFRPARAQSFADAMAISNNQCFGRIAVGALGAEQLLGEMRHLGLPSSPGPGHAPGRAEAGADALSLGRLGSGLAGSFITPLGAAQLAGSLATGQRVSPRWVAGVRDADGQTQSLGDAGGPEPAIDPETAAALRTMLVGVTRHGTASRAFVDGRGRPRLGPVEVAGKTGTLSGRDPDGLYQWFVGMAPAAHPKVALATLVVRDAPGTATASEVSRRVLASLFCKGERCGEATALPWLARAAERRARLDEERRAELRRLELIAASERAHAEELARREREALDQTPRPVATTPLEIPRHLRRGRTEGEVVLMLRLDPEGRVRHARVDASDLPALNETVRTTVARWRFTPPTRQGRPVSADARFPVAIRID